jgi:hypothetical protein
MRFAAKISAERRCRLDINNVRVVGIDEIIGGIGKKGRSAVRGCPPCCRIGRCNELRRHLACRTERRIVEHGEILLDGATRRFRRQTRGPFDAVAVAGVGLDQTGVDSKAFPTDQTLGNAALQYALKQTPQQGALTKPAVSVLREG